MELYELAPWLWPFCYGLAALYIAWVFWSCLQNEG